MYSTLLSFVHGKRTHNPSVPGSSPGCPILSSPRENSHFTSFSTQQFSSIYAKITQSTRINQRRRSYKSCRHLIQLIDSSQKPSRTALTLVTMDFVSNAIMHRHPLTLVPKENAELRSRNPHKFYQLFSVVRKKCVIFLNIHINLQYTQGLLHIVQRTTNPLFLLIPVYARVSQLIRRSNGKH